MPNKSFEFSCAEDSFMFVPTESYFSESLEFFVMIQHVIASAFSFSGCLEFVTVSNIPPFAGLDVCPLVHPRYILFPSLRNMPRVLTALHLHVAYIDDITRSIAI